MKSRQPPRCLWRHIPFADLTSIRLTPYIIFSTSKKEKGVAVIFVGEDLDVLIDLCDRIMVICGGKITGVIDGRRAIKEQIGSLMLGREIAENDENNKETAQNEAK